MYRVVGAGAGGAEVLVSLLLYLGGRHGGHRLRRTRILGVLPLTYVALRTRSVVPGIVAHTVLNLVDVLVILQFIIN
jgi:hypothetical protein